MVFALWNEESLSSSLCWNGGVWNYWHCLTSTYFQYNGKHYQQLHGTAMSLPVSVVVAEIVNQSIEEQALATYGLMLPFWFQYTDNTIYQFHNHLNSQNHDIQFTKEFKEKGMLPFLNCSVKHANDRLLFIENQPVLTDYSTNHPTTQLHTKPLPPRHWLNMHNLCHSPDALHNENFYRKSIWDHLVYFMALQHLCCTQTDNNFMKSTR